MANIKRFEDIRAWQEARKLTQTIYHISGTGPWAKDWTLQNQSRRAVISIMSNIAEGFGRQSDAEFARFLIIAKGSATELKSQLYIALDLKYIDQETFDNLLNQCDKILNLLGGFVRYLSSK